MKTYKRDSVRDIRKEYDFSNGIRGKYVELYAKGSNIVILEPEIAKEFPDSKSVNEALRSVLSIIKNHHVPA